MKLILLSVFTLAFITAYTQDIVAIDTIKVLCSYEYSYLSDTTSTSPKKYSKDILHLQIGSKCSKCFSYYSYQCDSLQALSVHEDYIKNMIKEYITKGGSRKELYHSLPRYRMKTRVYKNYPLGLMTVTDHILQDHYVYEDSLNLQEWDYSTDSTKTILGYTCQMATCRFRGRDWTAWFAIDIPISDGPWKFMGLPGLIMEAHDCNYHHWFCINGIQQIDSEVLHFGTEGKDFSIYQKVKRTDLLKSQYNYLRAPENYTFMATGISLGHTNSDVKHDLLEREGK